MWGTTDPLALQEGAHLLWPDRPQAAAGWHCPERPAAWNLLCCPQGLRLEGACQSPARSQGLTSPSERSLSLGRHRRGGHQPLPQILNTAQLPSTPDLDSTWRNSG